jgi:mRNA-degrading endonuclease HigB of HigAB toxin-antitoxin module
LCDPDALPRRTCATTQVEVWVRAMETPKERLYMFKPDELFAFQLATETGRAKRAAAGGRTGKAADIKRHYATASVINAERIVFNIKGNSYRLVVAVDFDKGIAWIKWLGSHREYDRIDVTEIRYEK